MSMRVRRPLVALLSALLLVLSPELVSGQSMGSSVPGQDAPAGALGPARPGTVNPHGPGGVPTTRAGSPLPPVGPVKPGVVNPHGGSTTAPGAAPSSSGGAVAPAGSPSTPVSGGLSFPKDAEPLPKGEGLVQGSLRHPTPDSARLKGIEVRLFAFKGGQRLQEWRQFTQPDGTFRFPELNTSPDVKYIVSAMYQAAVYLGGNLQFAEGQKLLEVPIEVKDSMAAPGPLSIKTLHIIVEVAAQDGTLRLTEVMELDNPGEKTLVGGPESTTTLQLDMPVGFVNVQALQGLLSTQLSVGEKVLAFEGPIYPGESQLVFSYDLPPQASKVFKRRMPVGASEVDVWVEPGGPAVLGPQLSQKKPITVEETTFNRFSAGALNKGAALTFSVGMGESASASQTSLPTLPIVSVVIFLSLAFVLQPFFRKQRTTALTGPNAQKLRQAELISARDRALQSVKEAEFDFAAGKLTVEDHQTLREVYKTEAIQAIQALKALDGDSGGASSAQLEAADPVPAASPTVAADAVPHAGTSASADAEQAAAASSSNPKKRFCTSCGTSAEPADRFCLACGKPIRSLEAPGS